MNNTRRKEIKQLMSILEKVNANLENLQAEEEGAMAAIEENFSGTDRYEKMEECSELLGNAMDDISTAITELEECLK